MTVVPSFELQGHEASVLCLDYLGPTTIVIDQSTCCLFPNGDKNGEPLTNDETALESVRTSLLLSGSEDGTARLWDLRGVRRKRACCCLTIQVDTPVMSVAFGPSRLAAVSDNGPMNNNSTIDASTWHDIFVSTDNFVYRFDLRKADQPVLTLDHPSLVVPQSTRIDCAAAAARNPCWMLQCQDEINQIQFMPIVASHTPCQNQRHQQKKTPGRRAMHKASTIRKSRRNNNRQTFTAKSQDLPRPENHDIDNDLDCPALSGHGPLHAPPDAAAGTGSCWNLLTADDAGMIRIIPICVASVKGDDSSIPIDQHDITLCHGTDENPAMVTALALRKQILAPPSISDRARNVSYQYMHQIATGGTDCTIQLWDLKDQKNRRNHQTRKQHVQSESNLDSFSTPTCCISIRDLDPTDSNATPTQLVNPPMVHDLDWSPSGQLLAAALGDGSVLVLQYQKALATTGAGALLRPTLRLADVHPRPVAAVCFAPADWWFRNHDGASIGLTNQRTNGTTAAATTNANTTIPMRPPAWHVTALDRLLMTAGNDGVLTLWDLQTGICGDKAWDPTLHVLGRHNQSQNNLCGVATRITRQSDKTNDDISSSEQNHKLDVNGTFVASPPSNHQGNDNHQGEDWLVAPRQLFQIVHNHKPNWMVCTSGQDVTVPGTVWVADTSCNISGYQLM